MIFLLWQPIGDFDVFQSPRLAATIAEKNKKEVEQ